MKTTGGVRLLSIIRRLIQGTLIGAGGILPGISGGVLSAVFGLYFPIMELLTSPRQGIRKYFKLLLPVGVGALIGFFSGGAVISLLFGANDTVAGWLFLGFIVSTLPALWREAKKEGSSPRDRSLLWICFVIFTAVLLYARYGRFERMEPDFLDFVFSGVLWGLSIIVPGMTSSSILMAVGLFEPMAFGISSLDMSVLIPWLLGLVAVVAALSRLVTRLFKKNYSLVYHSVFGLILASTISMIPPEYTDSRELILSVAVGIAGAAAGFACEALEEKMKTGQKTDEITN